jgi:glutamate 5-kinase
VTATGKEPAKRDFGKIRSLVVKVGSSSLTAPGGGLDESQVQRLASELGRARRKGLACVLVSSGAIAAGLEPLGIKRRPGDIPSLQAAASVGQGVLMHAYQRAFARRKMKVGQVLLTQDDFIRRKGYVNARAALTRLLALGVVPIVNENDTVAVEEIRFGDNDRLAALVAHLVGASTLILLTDTPGMYTADPRLNADASLIEEIVEVDHELERAAGGTGSDRGSGGMASKLAAAKIAAWSGVRAIIAGADRDGVLRAALAGEPGAGTVLRPHDRRLPARKLWIAFAVGATGTVLVDDGARRALTERNTSLLPAGVVDVVGSFEAEAAVEIADRDGNVFAKGLTRHSAARVREWAGRRTTDLPAELPHEVVHRDDLVVLP